MRNCNNCGQENHEGALICKGCGRGLYSDAHLVATRKLAHENASDWVRGEYQTHQTRSNESTLPTRELIVIGDPFAASNGKIFSVVLRLPGATEKFVLYGPQPIVAGRVDSSDNPSLNLTPYGADEKGVSRHHAAFQLNDGVATLMDMNSSNGTYINGQGLHPKRPALLHYGDEIRLGRLTMQVFMP